MVIKELRHKHGWSQSAMAQLLGVNREQYKKWEQRGQMPAKYLPAFSKLTNTPIETILGNDHPWRPRL